MSWKKQWLKELDNMVPAESEEVKRVPLPDPPERQNKRGIPKKFWFVFAPVAAVIIVAIVLTAVFVGGDGSNPATGGEPMVLTVEINPAASFVTDKNGVITKVIALNSDADILLSGLGKDALVGKSASDGVGMYVDTARKLDYIDSEAGGAVRMSFCSGSDSDVASIKNGIETYSEESGVFIAVIDERVDIAEYLTRSGLDGEYGDIDALVNALNATDEYYVSRTSEGQTVTALQESYKNALSDYGNIFASVADALNSNLTKYTGYVKDLIEIVNANNSIMFNSSYLSIIPASYWYIKDNYAPDEFSSEFAALMGKMDTLLTEFNQKYGKSIDSFEALRALTDKYQNVTLDNIKEYINRFSSEYTFEDIEWLVDLADELGLIDDDFAEIVNLPKDAVEYVVKYRKVLSEEYKSRVDGNKEYDKERAAITADDYNARISALIAEYGSLAEYWANTKK